MNFLTILLVIVGGIIVALFFEESRDYIVEAGEYIFSFEWLGDIWEFISAGFEDLSDFSVYGIIFGALTLGLTYLIRKQTVNPFFVTMVGPEKVLWMTVTYVGVFVGGYLMGKAFENTG